MSGRVDRACRRALWVLALVCGAITPAHADPGGDFDGLVAQGEAALRANDSVAAVRAYERAAALRHAAVAEWGLVRSWMQSGEYRRALAFAAHAAGSHPELVEGAGLYAWLLNIGGQPAIARQTLDDARRQHPNDALLAATAARLERPAAPPAPALLDGATRQAPHAALVLPASARAVASGLLSGDGLRALVPDEAVAPAASLWLRDATGRTTAARLGRSWPELGLAELLLALPMRAPEAELAFAARDPFAGSPEMAVEFPASPELPAQPAWPLLHTGFVGAWQSDRHYALGAELAARGPHGGPVFDRAGRVIGLALRSADGTPMLLAVSALRALWPEVAVVDAAPSAPLVSPDVVYERAMASVVQLVVQPPDEAVRP